MKRTTLTLIAVTIAFLFTGCITTSNKYPEKNFFVLETSRNRQVIPEISDSTVEVRKFSSPSLKSGKEFIYRYPDGKFKSDYYNGFFVDPSKMVTDETISWLENSGLFNSIVNSKNSYGADLVLEGNIGELYADFSGDNVKSVMQIKFFINETETGKYVPVFHGEYKKEIQADSKAPEDLVTAWNRALEQILSDFEDDIMVNMGRQ